MNNRPVIIELIEKGYNNAEIKSATHCTLRYIRNIRSEYNDSSPIPKLSRHKAPAENTLARKAYDMIKANPLLTDMEIADATGMARASVYCTRRRYFGLVNIKLNTYHIEYSTNSKKGAALVQAATQKEAEHKLVNALSLPLWAVDKVSMLRTLPAVMQLQHTDSYHF